MRILCHHQRNRQINAREAADHNGIGLSLTGAIERQLDIHEGVSHVKSKGFTTNQSALFVVFLFLSVCAASGPCLAEQLEFFVIWGDNGRWNSELTIENGRFIHVEPYLLTGDNDKITKTNAQQVVCTSDTRGSVDGLHIQAEVNAQTSVTFSSDRTTQAVRPAELPDGGQKITYIDSKKNFLIFGKGNPASGPRGLRKIKMPPVFEPPTPANAVRLPNDWANRSDCVQIHLSQAPQGQLAVRRGSGNDEFVYLEIYLPGQRLRGQAEVNYQNESLGTVTMDGSLWLSLRPRMGKIFIEIEGPGGQPPQKLSVPTTLIETRGNKLFLNGEPFLIKGTLPRNLNDKDARYIKDLCMNTLRGKEALEIAEKYQFMVIASIQGGPNKLVTAAVSPTEQTFKDNVQTYLNNLRDIGRAASQNPYTLIIQLGNEQAGAAEPWSDVLRDRRQFERLDCLLANAWNLVKPMDPMVPLGYANHALGYIAPDFLDVYMHNSYLNEDRYGVPLETFMEWQGCDKRPFVNTEFGANRYLPQAYHGAENSPVLEKIHAWNYIHRWRTYMDAGTIGGTSYCMYDLDAPRDQGCSNFGILTMDRQPKLACWEIWHLWRDFEVEVKESNTGALLTLNYHRDYWARNCRFSITCENQTRTFELKDFAPHSKQALPEPLAAKTFRWRMDYTTHQGLGMASVGAYPVSVEQRDFQELLKDRKNAEFLRELFDSEVVTIDNQTAPATLAAMTRSDQVVPVAFRKPNGVIYITAFARLDPGKELYVKADLDTAFQGKLAAIDEWTGKPLDTPVKWDKTKKGIRIREVMVPRIPGAIGKRSDKPLSLPVFRITPED